MNFQALSGWEAYWWATVTGVYFTEAAQQVLQILFVCVCALGGRCLASAAVSDVGDRESLQLGRHSFSPSG